MPWEVKDVATRRRGGAAARRRGGAAARRRGAGSRAAVAPVSSGWISA
nr:hypothetical protein [Actinomadura meyerae]